MAGRFQRSTACSANARGGDGQFEHAAILWFTTSVYVGERRRRRRQLDDDYEGYPEYGGD